MDNTEFKHLWMKWKEGKSIADGELRKLQKEMLDIVDKMNIVLIRDFRSREINPTTYFLRIEYEKIVDLMHRRNLL